MNSSGRGFPFLLKSQVTLIMAKKLSKQLTLVICLTQMCSLEIFLFSPGILVKTETPGLLSTPGPLMQPPEKHRYLAMSNCLFTELQALMGHPVEAHGKGRSRKNSIRLEIGAWDGVPTKHMVSKPAP